MWTTIGIAPAQTVPVSGQQAHSQPVGVTFSPIDFAFGFGYLNNTGHIAFLAFVQGPGNAAGKDRGTWVADLARLP